MTIKFEKLSPDIPNFILQSSLDKDATPEVEAPFSIFFTYNHSAIKGTFVWEGELTEGQLKFR